MAVIFLFSLVIQTTPDEALQKMLTPLQIGFLSLNVFYSPIGYLVYNHEKFVPAFVLRIVKYGAFCYKGNGARFMSKLNLPKYYYKHFYVFAITLEVFNLCYMGLVYVCNFEVNLYYVKFLQALNGNTPPVSVLASTVTLCLLTLQCVKRFYESYYVQVFATTSKVYPTHYIVGFLFYLAVITAIVSQAPLFSGDKNRDTIVWADFKTIIMLIPAIPVFLWAWYEQHQANLILANLRKDKKSKRVITEEHKIPHGRLFESISSPHRFCEIVLYGVLFSIMQTKTFFCIFLWVLCNQIQTSMLVHKWYKTTFQNYPSERYALFKSIM